MSTYKPDRWVIVKISSDDNTHYRVFASWAGGYTSGDSWKLSSGCEGCEINEEGSYDLPQTSGSNYVLRPTGYGTTGWSAGILLGIQKNFEEQHKDKNGKLEILSEEDSITYIESLNV